MDATGFQAIGTSATGILVQQAVSQANGSLVKDVGVVVGSRGLRASEVAEGIVGTGWVPGSWQVAT